MANLNREMVRKGYAPLTQVALATSKHRTTIHRMAKAGHIRVAEDGHATYVDLRSLLKFYEEQNNKPMMEAINKLGARLLKDVSASETRDARGAG